MSKSSSRRGSTSKKGSLEDDSLLRFDMVVTWEVKDMCYWLDAVGLSNFHDKQNNNKTFEHRSQCSSHLEQTLKVWLNDLVVSALGIRTRLNSRVVTIFH